MKWRHDVLHSQLLWSVLSIRGTELSCGRWGSWKSGCLPQFSRLYQLESSGKYGVECYVISILPQTESKELLVHLSISALYTTFLYLLPRQHAAEVGFISHHPSLHRLCVSNQGHRGQGCASRRLCCWTCYCPLQCRTNWGQPSKGRPYHGVDS